MYILEEAGSLFGAQEDTRGEGRDEGGEVEGRWSVARAWRRRQRGDVRDVLQDGVERLEGRVLGRPAGGSELLGRLHRAQ